MHCFARWPWQRHWIKGSLRSSAPPPSRREADTHTQAPAATHRGRLRCMHGLAHTHTRAQTPPLCVGSPPLCVRGPATLGGNGTCCCQTQALTASVAHVQTAHSLHGWQQRTRWRTTRARNTGLAAGCKCPYRPQPPPPHRAAAAKWEVGRGVGKEGGRGDGAYVRMCVCACVRVCVCARQERVHALRMHSQLFAKSIVRRR